MRSRKSLTLTDRKVQALTESWLAESLDLSGAGWKCTAGVLWQVVLLAAARMTSLFAACKDLTKAPSDEAVRKTLRKRLPKRFRTLEQKLEQALCGHLPKCLFTRAWRVAIDWHWIPYHGEPHRRANELCHSKPKSGTTKFHVYATACIVQGGYRYTLAATYVLSGESSVTILARLLDRMAERGFAIKALLLDRQFFASHVLAFLQSRGIPFLMPIVLRGRRPKKGRSPKRASSGQEMRAFRKLPAGRYTFTWAVKGVSVTFTVVVAYQSFIYARTGRRRNKKLLYAAWQMPGAPIEIRELYRKRFGIESCFRQLGEARVHTSTTDPMLRLFFVLVGLVLRNVWVWLHLTYFAETRGRTVVLRLNLLRHRQMLRWIERVIAESLHDGSDYKVEVAF
jgi:Transposase DDE domain